LADWLPYSLHFNSLDFSIWHISKAKDLATSRAKLTALCPFIAAKWNQLAVEYIRKTCY
jgi:hypothetical protein